MQNAVMFPMAGLGSRWRLLMALLLSVTLHLVVLAVRAPFWPAEKHLLPELKDWRMDVKVELRGDTAPPATPQHSQEKSVKAEKAARKAPPMLPEQSGMEAAQLAAPRMPQSAEEPAAEQQTPAAQQVQAFAGAMSNLVNMQYILSQMKTFYALSRDHIKFAVLGLLTEEQMRHYAGAVCTATLTYATSGGEEDVRVDCGARQELADALSSRINWNALPQPEKYSLDYRRMTITVWFEGYQVQVGLKSED